jgi:hypothetical protein
MPPVKQQTPRQSKPSEPTVNPAQTSPDEVERQQLMDQLKGLSINKLRNAVSCLGLDDGIELVKCYGSNAITKEVMERILGWEVVPKEAGKDADYLFEDMRGDKIRLLYNSKNRPFEIGRAKMYMQDMLNGKWRFNGESFIIGEKGNVISAQHRGVGYLLACQMWEGGTTPEQKDHWQKKWPNGLTLETVVVRGVSEDPELLRTLDNVRPRTFGDVLYVLGTFGSARRADRAQMVKILQFATSVVRDRTHAARDPYESMATNSEAQSFTENHPSLAKSVQAIWDAYGTESARKAAQSIVPMGLAAALHYLMATSVSDPTRYYGPDLDHPKLVSERTEDGLDFNAVVETGQTVTHAETGQQLRETRKIWDRASDFLIHLVRGHEDLNNVRNALGKGGLLEQQVRPHLTPDQADYAIQTVLNKITPIMKTGVLAKAWKLFLEAYPQDKGVFNLDSGDTLFPQELALEYKPKLVKVKDDPNVPPDTQRAFLQLADFPTFGGIDLGPVSESKKSKEEEETEEEETPEQKESKVAVNEEQRRKIQEHNEKVRQAQLVRAQSNLSKPAPEDAVDPDLDDEDEDEE